MFIKKLRSHFVLGIFVTIPIAITILILVWIFSTIDGILQPIVRAIWNRTIPGVGFAATIILIYLVGLLASNIMGKQLISYGESLLARVPGVRHLYSGVKQIVESFSASGKSGFIQVVLVDFPGKGMKAIGFLTNEFSTNSGEKLLTVFIPTAPNPTSGFVQIVKETEVIRTKIPVDEALRMIVSAGKLVSKGVIDRLSPPEPK